LALVPIGIPNTKVLAEVNKKYWQRIKSKQLSFHSYIDRLTDDRDDLIERVRGSVQYHFALLPK
jgi:hypothetical protein